jgi:hypothetical protein
VVRDKKGEIYTVRYDAVNSMSLNEFLKEHHQVQDLKTIRRTTEANQSANCGLSESERTA